ncbi:MarR family winged helix-turn-helix transcriptional regulator [Negadavirga shengliensis]|uniref:MarR family winged helix-turn-helix transcriptional regulator n=1 Tax=Negadavirga shengliensis TaxID=1389218 RepID=A0ABV9T6Z3_9BACT
MDNPTHSPELLDLVKSIKDLTRETLLFQSLAALSIGLNATDGECLDFLMERKSTTAGELAKLTGLTTGAITSVIDRLERSGFVKREKDPLDRRKVIVTYLPGKEKKAAQIYGALAHDVILKLSHYNNEELESLREFTQSLIEIYRNNASKISRK